jgi:hypothetical protein
MGLYGAFSSDESLAVVLFIGAFSGLVFGLAMTYWVRHTRRRSGLAELEPGSQRSLSRVLRTGQAPADRSLYPALEQTIGYRRKQLRIGRFTYPAVYGILTVTTVPAALGDPRYWLLILLFVGFLIACPFATRRAEARLDAVERGMRA